MGNIEAMPGGFNALRRMYEDVQEPMMRAAEQAPAAPSAPVRQISPDNPFAQVFGHAASAEPNNEPLPNPWGGRAPAAAPAGAGMPGAGAGAGNPFSILGGARLAQRLFFWFFIYFKITLATGAAGPAPVPAAGWEPAAGCRMPRLSLPC
jgi:hypothetical protein